MENKNKMLYVVADPTGQTTLTLWEEDIGMIVESKSYQLNRIQIHHYLGKTDITRFGATAEEIGDVLDQLPTLPDDDDDTDLVSVSVIGVSQPEVTFLCVSCKESCHVNHTALSLTASSATPNKNLVIQKCVRNYS